MSVKLSVKLILRYRATAIDIIHKVLVQLSSQLISVETVLLQIPKGKYASIPKINKHAFILQLVFAVLIPQSRHSKVKVCASAGASDMSEDRGVTAGIVKL